MVVLIRPTWLDSSLLSPMSKSNLRGRVFANQLKYRSWSHPATHTSKEEVGMDLQTSRAMKVIMDAKYN